MVDKARRKELQIAYKLARPPMGIFAIRNTVNGKTYLDKSTNLNGSLNRHRLELKLGTHRNPAYRPSSSFHPLRRKPRREYTPAAEFAVDFKHRLMPRQGVFDDRQAEAGAAGFS